LPGLITLIAALAVDAAVAAQHAAPDWHPTDEITTVAEGYLLALIGSTTNDTTVQAGNLDARHRLARCSQRLEPYLRRGTEIKSRTIVGVRCSGRKPWKVYLPVDVVVTQTVLVATRTLARGHTLSADDVRAQRRDVSRLLSGYLTNVGAIEGQQLKTQLLAGKILTPAMLKIRLAIHRGQTVTLVIGGGGVSVRSRGTALMNGAVSQRIRVENTQSGREVEGIVRSSEEVEVLLTRPRHFSSAAPKASSKLADTGSSNNDR